VKHARLITVLTFAVMIIILAYLVASVTSCNLLPEAGASMVAPTVVHPTPTLVPPNGTIYHPITLDDPGPYLETWKVTTEAGMQQWLVNPVFAANVHPGTYIMHNSTEYKVSGIDRKALTMSAVILGN
jgi:hypothetical protein